MCVDFLSPVLYKKLLEQLLLFCFYSKRVRAKIAYSILEGVITVRREFSQQFYKKHAMETNNKNGNKIEFYHFI